MSLYKPKFTMTERERRGKKSIALWVTMPNGDRFNIWDLKKAPDKDAQQALQVAFERGFKAAQMITTRELNSVDIRLDGFEEEQ